MKLLQPHEVQSRLESAIPDSKVLVQDLTGGLDHYRVVIVSPAFEGLMLIKRHQMVNEALKEELKGPIHALTIEAFTPAQWEQKKSSEQTPQQITFK